MEFHLDSFDGPLDLLLHLISKNKVSIYDIPIAEILEQYMAVLREAETMDMDVAGDFIAMAAQLVYIKSRMLLPQREETPGEDDPRAELVDMLLEYQRFRQATAFFREKGEEGADMLTKAPEPLGDAPREVHGVPNDLIRAANRLLRRVSRRIPPPATAFAASSGASRCRSRGASVPSCAASCTPCTCRLRGCLTAHATARRSSRPFLRCSSFPERTVSACTARVRTSN